MDTRIFGTLSGDSVEFPVNKIELRPSVYGIVLRGDEVLLIITRTSGKYFLPGGAIEKGETVKEAVKREIYEETGVTVKVQNLVGYEESYMYYQLPDLSDMACQVIALIFLCEAQDFELTGAHNVKDDEAESAVWVNINSLTKDKFQAFGKTILNILKDLKNNV